MKTKTPWAGLNRSAHSGSELSVNQPSEIAGQQRLSNEILTSRFEAKPRMIRPL
jgi:hypothetical protein